MISKVVETYKPDTSCAYTNNEHPSYTNVGEDCNDSECKTRCDKQWHKDKTQWLHQYDGYEWINDFDNIGGNDHHVWMQFKIKSNA